MEGRVLVQIQPQPSLSFGLTDLFIPRVNDTIQRQLLNIASWYIREFESTIA